MFDPSKEFRIVKKIVHAQNCWSWLNYFAFVTKKVDFRPIMASNLHFVNSGKNFIFYMINWCVGIYIFEVLIEKTIFILKGWKMGIINWAKNGNIVQKKSVKSGFMITSKTETNDMWVFLTLSSMYWTMSHIKIFHFFLH